MRLRGDRFWSRSPSFALLLVYPFFGEGSTKIDYRKKGTLILTSGGPSCVFPVWGKIRNNAPFNSKALYQ